jgi:hypothetical protein
MKSLDEFVKDVERDLVIGLVLATRYKKISKKEARDIARDFISKIPFKDHEQVFEKIYEMSDRYWVVRKIYIKYAIGFEKEKDEYMLKEVRDFMKISDFENAIKKGRGRI